MLKLLLRVQHAQLWAAIWTWLDQKRERERVQVLSAKAVWWWLNRSLAAGFEALRSLVQERILSHIHNSH